MPGARPLGEVRNSQGDAVLLFVGLVLVGVALLPAAAGLPAAAASAVAVATEPLAGCKKWPGRSSTLDQMTGFRDAGGRPNDAMLYAGVKVCRGTRSIIP